MAQSSSDRARLPVKFVGLGEGEPPPRIAVYQLDSVGRPTRKIGVSDGEALEFTEPLETQRVIALGPDVENLAELTADGLVSYHVPRLIDQWRKDGLILGAGILDRIRFHYICVDGTVSKCRPWFWDYLTHPTLQGMFRLAQPARIKPITADLEVHRFFPLVCQPICDGIVEVYERECCCHRIIRIPELIEHLHEILVKIPIPLPDPPPRPPSAARSTADHAAGSARQRPPDSAGQEAPRPVRRSSGEAVRRLRRVARDAGVGRSRVPARASLPVRVRVLLQHAQGRRGGHPARRSFRVLLPRTQSGQGLELLRTYAFKVKQSLNGVWTVVYDGVNAGAFFAEDESADLHVFNPKARPCAESPGTPPPNGGTPFVMLEYVGKQGTHHFNFPAQTAVSQVGALDDDDGTITFDAVPDRPWGGGLGLRLWVSPELKGVVHYYRFKVVAVNDAGSAVGTPVVLDSSVTWDKYVDVGASVITQPELLGPNPVGSEQGLFVVPYWSSPDHRYLSSQLHQSWNTAQATFPDGKYMLILELFDSAGNRVKPTTAPGPGTPKNFEFRRWSSTATTAAANFADAAHVFWVDNTPVGGDIVDLRKGLFPNTGECQFLTGTKDSTFSIGFRAYHVHGVDHAGNGDKNSFMEGYSIRWTRGLNGSTGVLGASPAGGDNHTDVGETGDPAASGTNTFEEMLTRSDGSVLSKCSFSLTLTVSAKHFDGVNPIAAYGYQETAAFALEILPPSPPVVTP